MNAMPFSRATLLAIAASTILFLSTSAFGAATIVILNNDAAGVGFNDATVVAPVGGNAGTTLGQQRLNAFQAAAAIWGATLSSTPTITIRANWAALPCTTNAATLGQAGTVNIFRDFAGTPFAGTWYSAALANKIVGSDLDANPEINATFNVNLGNPGCLDGTHFYLGLDNNHLADVDLVTILLHEFAHGFGFQTFTSSSTGAQTADGQGPHPSIYDRFLFDNTTGKTWKDMTDAERAASAINTGQLAWNGFQVTSAVHTVLASPFLKINLPAAIAGNYTVGTAGFGAALTTAGVTRNIVQALPTDGCSALTNGGTVSGQIALIDRGGCNFVVKVKNAQNAGAVGVVIVNNVSGAPIDMGGTDATITIPSVMVSDVNGTTIRNQFGVGVNGSMLLDTSVPSGADVFGRALMHTPNPLVAGSSVSHWTTLAFPNQLMEPSNTGDLTHSVTTPQDLAFSLLRDVGWVANSATSIQFSAANYNASEGAVSVDITVNRSGDLTGFSTVDFATSDGTAKQKSDYEINNGTLTFAPGDTSKTFTVLIEDDAFVEGSEAVNLTLSNPAGATLAAPSTATITIADNDTAGATSPVSKQFVANLVGGQETPPTPNVVITNGGIVQLNAAETSAKVSLIFSGLSSAETAAHIHVGQVGVAGPIIFPLPTTNPVSNFLIAPTSTQVGELRSGQHYMNVHSVNFPNGEIRGQLLWNPMEEPDAFVRQAYFDFLARTPDAGGLAFWISKITDCQSDVQCLRDRRNDVSNQFYAELEFQQTGAYVYRLYRAAYGNNQPFPNPNPDPMFPNEEKTMPDYPVFVADRARVIGSNNLAQSQLDLATAFVQRAEFVAKYPLTLNTADQFVTAVLNTIKNDLGPDLTAQKPALITNYNTGGRALVMFHLANDYWNKCAGAPCVPTGFGTAVDNRPLIDAEYNRAFVLTEYWGYLRRNPDIFGFRFWLGRVNTAPLRDQSQQRRMVCVFATSPEFQFRFGPVASRNNNECL